MPLNISGLKCDFCDYRDDSVPYSDYQASIGRPCPKCGNSLLTQKEFDECERIIRGVNRVEKILHWLRFFNPKFYLRLIFGDNRDETQVTIKFLNKNKSTQQP